MTIEDLFSEFYSAWSNRDHPVMVRHAESLKNVQSKRGGLGLPLTPRGLTQCSELAESLRQTGYGWDAVISGPTAQVEQTAYCLDRDLHLPVVVDDRLRGIHLGKLSGLTELEMATRHPQAWAVFQTWEQGKIAMDEFRIQGKETGLAFSARVLPPLIESLNLFANPIFVVGRSILILASSILEAEGLLSLDEFFHRNWENCSGILGSQRLSLKGLID